MSRRPGRPSTSSWRRGPVTARRPTGASASCSASSCSSSRGRSRARSGSRACRRDARAHGDAAARARRPSIPAGRGTIYDRTGEPLAIGEQATTVYADPREIANPRRGALAAAQDLGVDAERAVPALADRRGASSTCSARPIPSQGGALREATSPGSASTRRSGGRTRSAASRRTCSATRASTTTASTGSSGRSTASSRAGRAARRSIRDPFGRVIDVLAQPERPGRDVGLTIDHQIQANAEAVLRETVERWGAKGGIGDRARPAHGRGARDGGRARVRREPLRQPSRPTAAATARSRTCTSRARPSSS